MEFANPPPEMSQQVPNFNIPPPSITGLRPQGEGGGGRNYHHHGAGKPGQPYFRPFVNFARGPGGLPMTQDDFDGKRLRKSVMRKTVDYNASIVRALQVNIKNANICKFLNINLLFRVEFGNVITVTGELYSPKVFMLQKYYRHPATQTIQLMRSQHVLLKLPPIR